MATQQALRIYACLIQLNERILHNFVTALADYKKYPKEISHLRLGPAADVAAGKPALWLDVCELPLQSESDTFPDTVHVEHVCGCDDVSAAA